MSIIKRRLTIVVKFYRRLKSPYVFEILLVKCREKNAKITILDNLIQLFDYQISYKLYTVVTLTDSPQDPGLLKNQKKCNSPEEFPGLVVF